MESKMREQCSLTCRLEWLWRWHWLRLWIFGFLFLLEGEQLSSFFLTKELWPNSVPLLLVFSFQVSLRIHVDSRMMFSRSFTRSLVCESNLFCLFFQPHSPCLVELVVFPAWTYSSWLDVAFSSLLFLPKENQKGDCVKVSKSWTCVLVS